jgi:hypothetical protein
VSPLTPSNGPVHALDAEAHDITDKVLEAIQLLVQGMGGAVVLDLRTVTPEGLADLNRVFAPSHIRGRFRLVGNAGSVRTQVVFERVTP